MLTAAVTTPTFKRRWATCWSDSGQASESKSTFRTVHSTYRKDRCVKVASPESDVQPCVFKPCLPCRVREAQLSPCRRSAENDCTNDYGTHKTTPTSSGTLGAVSGSLVGPGSGPGRAREGLASAMRTGHGLGLRLTKNENWSEGHFQFSHF